MKKEEYQEKAFPLSSDRDMIRFRGMTLLDYFAGKALQGLISNSNMNLKDKGIGVEIVKASYSVAEEMMKERKKYLS